VSLVVVVTAAITIKFACAPPRACRLLVSPPAQRRYLSVIGTMFAAMLRVGILLRLQIYHRRGRGRSSGIAVADFSTPR